MTFQGSLLNSSCEILFLLKVSLKLNVFSFLFLLIKSQQFESSRFSFGKGGSKIKEFSFDW